MSLKLCESSNIPGRCLYSVLEYHWQSVGFALKITGMERMANRRKGHNWDSLVETLHISQQEKSSTMSDSIKFRWSRSVKT